MGGIFAESVGLSRGIIAAMTASLTLYGIPNCDTVKKARSWLTERQIPYHFHDFKKNGVPAPQLQRWLAAVGWDKVLNRQGTTWRKLDAQAQAAVTDAASAAALLLENPSAIKRPVVEWNGPGGEVTVGFKPDEWESRLAA